MSDKAKHWTDNYPPFSVPDDPPLNEPRTVEPPPFHGQLSPNVGRMRFVCAKCALGFEADVVAGDQGTYYPLLCPACMPEGAKEKWLEMVEPPTPEIGTSDFADDAPYLPDLLRVLEEVKQRLVNTEARLAVLETLLKRG